MSNAGSETKSSPPSVGALLREARDALRVLHDNGHLYYGAGRESERSGKYEACMVLAKLDSALAALADLTDLTVGRDSAPTTAHERASLSPPVPSTMKPRAWICTDGRGRSLKWVPSGKPDDTPLYDLSPLKEPT